MITCDTENLQCKRNKYEMEDKTLLYGAHRPTSTLKETPY